MVSESDIIEAFQSMNIPVSDNVLVKCLELCSSYRLDAEDLFDQWLAYTSSFLNGAPPSVSTLEAMERKELKKRLRWAPSPKAQPMDISEPIPVAAAAAAASSPLTNTFTPKQKFEKMNSGTIVNEFGVKADSFKSQCEDVLSIKVVNNELGQAKYMFMTLADMRNAISAMATFVIQDICQNNNLELGFDESKDYSGEMFIYGRIFGDNSGLLKSDYITLEGTIGPLIGERFKVLINNLGKFYLFNGQNVVIKGNNMRNYFIAKELYTTVSQEHPKTLIEIPGNLQLVVAAGPYTLSDNILYEPLEELLRYVQKVKPNILVLLGPFVGKENIGLKKSGESYRSLFEKVVNVVMTKLKGTDIKVVLVPSTKDIFNHIVFPSPSFRLKKQYSNLVLACNPLSVNIQGLLMAANCEDILLHLSKNEFYKDKHQLGTDRISRLISHLFSQRNFYPLYPPDEDVRVDYELLEKYGLMDNLPHLIFLPSKFQHFTKVVNNCVAINPGQLTRGNIAGTFARIQVAVKESFNSECVSCQIIRL